LEKVNAGGDTMIKVGLLGCGTVGSGVVELLDKNLETISRRMGDLIELTRVVDQDLDLNGDGIPDVQPVDKNIDIDNDGDPDGNVDGGIDFTVSSKSKDENDEDVIDADKNVQVDGKEGLERIV
jgi:homoserine dehydrogenase